MKRFCTEGPVDPKECYYIERKELIKEAIERIEQWRYFTISAPRQTGKTTFLENLISKISDDYTIINFSFELINDKDEFSFIKSILEDLKIRYESLGEEYIFEGIEIEDIQSFLFGINKVYRRRKKEIILIIDEFEGMENSEIINRFLHGIRKVYHHKKAYGLRSVIISSVEYLGGIISDNASPFNIADHLEIPYFTREQVYDLLYQHEKESEQRFDKEVKGLIWQNTAGQPGLVNALARDLVEKKAKNERIITKKHFEKTFYDFTKKYIDKHIMNIISKAKEKRELIMKILFDPKSVEFDIYDPDIQFLKLNGVIDECEKKCCVKVPLYYKALYTYFKPKENGEKKYMKDIKDTSKQYLREDETIDMEKLLDRYVKYIKERGAKMFQGKKYYEGVYQYNLDAFLSSYVEDIGGVVYPEVEIGGGRVDLLVEHRGEEYIIEIKAEPDGDEYEKGKRQLMEYVKRKGLEEGYYVVFSSAIERNEKIEEEKEGKKIKIWLIKTKYEQPSKVK